MFKKIARRFPVGPALWVGVVLTALSSASLLFMKHFSLISDQWFGMMLLTSLLIAVFTLAENKSPWMVVGIFTISASICIALFQEDPLWRAVDIFITVGLVLWGLEKLKEFPGGWRTPLWNVLGQKE